MHAEPHPARNKTSSSSSILPRPSSAAALRVNHRRTGITGPIAALAEGVAHSPCHCMVMSAQRARTHTISVPFFLFLLKEVHFAYFRQAAAVVGVRQWRLVLWESSQLFCSCCPHQHGLCGRMMEASSLQSSDCHCCPPSFLILLVTQRSRVQSLCALHHVLGVLRCTCTLHEYRAALISAAITHQSAFPKKTEELQHSETFFSNRFFTDRKFETP